MIKTIVIDEEGYFILPGGIRLNDESVGHQMLTSLSKDEFGVLTLEHESETIFVEAFDKPFVVKQVHLKQGQLIAQMPYHLQLAIDKDSLCLDEWDRFHGKTVTGMPVVFSRPAQAELFSLASHFTDDSLTLGSQSIKTPDYYLDSSEVEKPLFWDQKYNEKSQPKWDLDQPHPELKSFLQQLKMNKLRVLVPGCGYGHDAALLAQKGHIVTAVDFSQQAIDQAQKRYGHLKNLHFEVGDIFNLNESHSQAYDLIFEHTLYCAVAPNKRSRLIETWKTLLAETGHLLGVFFVVPKRSGPYFGSSEWELREKLEKSFQFLYWTRLKHSPGWRLGAELMIYAQIKPH